MTTITVTTVWMDGKGNWFGGSGPVDAHRNPIKIAPECVERINKLMREAEENKHRSVFPPDTLYTIPPTEMGVRKGTGCYSGRCAEAMMGDVECKNGCIKERSLLYFPEENKEAEEPMYISKDPVQSYRERLKEAINNVPFEGVRFDRHEEFIEVIKKSEIIDLLDKTK